jgi:hypothetical protein
MDGKSFAGIAGLCGEKSVSADAKDFEVGCFASSDIGSTIVARFEEGGKTLGATTAALTPLRARIACEFIAAGQMAGQVPSKQPDTCQGRAAVTSISTRKPGLARPATLTTEAAFSSALIGREETKGS